MPLHAMRPLLFTNSIDTKSKPNSLSGYVHAGDPSGMQHETPPTAPGHYSEKLSAIC